MTRWLPLALALFACNSGDETPAGDDTEVADTTDTTDTTDPAETAEPGDSGTEGAAFAGPANASFEADVVPDGGYVSSTTGAALTGWTYTTTEHGYLSLWNGWLYEDGYHTLPAPADGRQYLRFELWNTAQLPQDAEATLSTTFGPATGGASCALVFAATEVGYYTVPPLNVSVAWDGGSVATNVEADVHDRTGYDIDPVNGRWTDISLAVDLPADADGATLTATFTASATNLGPGIALAILVDNVRFTCE